MDLDDLILFKKVAAKERNHARDSEYLAFLEKLKNKQSSGGR